MSSDSIRNIQAKIRMIICCAWFVICFLGDGFLKQTIPSGESDGKCLESRVYG